MPVSCQVLILVRKRNEDIHNFKFVQAVDQCLLNNRSLWQNPSFALLHCTEANFGKEPNAKSAELGPIHIEYYARD